MPAVDTLKGQVQGNERCFVYAGMFPGFGESGEGYSHEWRMCRRPRGKTFERAGRDRTEDTGGRRQ